MENFHSDVYIINIVSGETIGCDETLNCYNSFPHNAIAKDHIPQVRREVTTLLSKNVIATTKEEESQFNSSICCVPEENNAVLLILNLNKFKSFVAYHYFEKEAIQHMLIMITPNYWIASIEIRDAY